LAYFAKLEPNGSTVGDMGILKKFKTISNPDSGATTKVFFRRLLVLLVKMRIIGRISEKVSFISEKQSWAVYWEGVGIGKAVNKKFKTPLMVVTSKVHRVHSPIIHFGSQYMWEIWRDLIPKSSKVVVNFFHGKPEDGDDVARHILDFVENSKRIDKIVVSNSITYNRLLSWGIEKDRITRIFIGVDRSLFKPENKKSKELVREFIGFKTSDFVIGSFQKDGIGWSDGLDPKLIKGPDILVKSLFEVSKSREIKVLLVGPSRGYVTKKLTEFGIDFKHLQVNNYEEMPQLYNALDLYLITSREEGGPKGLIEALASSIPVVSTPVGMSVDLLPRMQGCAVTETFNPLEIATSVIQAIDIPFRQEVGNSWQKTIEQVDFLSTGEDYLKYIYSQLDCTILEQC
jgi:glycosyltransferase involved in cell wall biosynthesis